MTTQVHTAVEHVEIVERQWLLQGSERRGCIGNLMDSVATMFGGGRHQRLAAGEYPYEVGIAIPTDAAGTHVGKVSRVFYELSARVDIPLGRDLNAMQSFTVEPNTIDNHRSLATGPRVRYPDDAGRGLWSSMFTPDVRMELTLDRSKVAIGESVTGRFVVETDKPLDVRRIDVRMVGHEQSEAQSHKDQFHHQGESISIDAPYLIAPSWSTEFTLPVEVEGPPSASGKLFAIDWFVEVELDVPWAGDPKLRAPIVLK